MEFKVIKRNGNAVVPDGMFKLCGLENAKLISMVQLNGGILLMPESVSTYQLLMLVDALNEQACEFLEAVAAECGPAEAEHRDMTLDEVLREFTEKRRNKKQEVSNEISRSLPASTLKVGAFFTDKRLRLQGRRQNHMIEHTPYRARDQPDGGFASQFRKDYSHAQI